MTLYKYCDFSDRFVNMYTIIQYNIMSYRHIIYNRACGKEQFQPICMVSSNLKFTDVNTQIFT